MLLFVLYFTVDSLIPILSKENNTHIGIIYIRIVYCFNSGMFN